MWSNVWIVVCLVAAAVATDGSPDNDKKLQKSDGVLPENQMNDKNAGKDTVGLNSGERRSAKSFKKAPAPMVDDDLLEFLVRVADNPAEWNKIQRVLSMLGRDETATQTAATQTVATRTAAATTGTAATTTTTTTARPVQPTRPAPTPLQPRASTADHDRGRGAPATGSWPSGEWILKTVETIRAAARAKGTGSGGVDGAAKDDAYDYEDDDEDDEDDDDAVDNYEIEEIEVPTTVQPPPPPPPQPRAAAAAHMSRYQFRRVDGHPGDGRVNGTYVAVVESDHRPPRGVAYDPARPIKPKPTK